MPIPLAFGFSLLLTQAAPRTRANSGPDFSCEILFGRQALAVRPLDFSGLLKPRVASVAAIRGVATLKPPLRVDADDLQRAITAKKAAGHWSSLSLYRRLQWLMSFHFVGELPDWEEVLDLAGLHFGAARSFLKNPAAAVEAPNGSYAILSYNSGRTPYVKPDVGFHDCIVITFYDRTHRVGAMIYPHRASDVRTLIQETLTQMRQRYKTNPARLEVQVVGGYAFSSLPLGLSILQSLEEFHLKIIALDFLNGLDHFIENNTWEALYGDRSVALDVSTGQLFTLDFSEEKELRRRRSLLDFVWNAAFEPLLQQPLVSETILNLSRATFEGQQAILGNNTWVDSHEALFTRVVQAIVSVLGSNSIDKARTHGRNALSHAIKPWAHIAA